MATYLYPEARELREIGPNLVTDLTMNDVLFQVMPIRTTNAPVLQWSLDDDEYGLQQLRGLDGANVHVIPTGRSSFMAEPGYFGEFETITERELTKRGGSIIGEATVDVSDLVARQFRQLVGREVNRIRQIIALLLTTGTFSVSGKGGTLTHTDTFAVQTDAGSDWSTPGTATPLADARDVQQMGSQYGVEFGAASLRIMNRVTANRMLSNTNTADLGGRRTVGGGTINSIEETNRIYQGEDLPQVVVYDKGYKNDAGTFVKFIPDDTVVYVGRRTDGDAIGEYRMTRNLNNPGGAPGSFEYIKDYAQGINAPKETPPRIETHRGHNGGPVLLRPSAIVVQSV
jgi:hypothetical protein